MKNSLYDIRHWKEYIGYGLISGLLYIIPSWIFLSLADYNEIYIIFFGSIFFMFVILFYVFRLSRRRTEYKSAWMMIIAAHFAILVGIIVAVVMTFILCYIYIPGFLSTDTTQLIKDTPGAQSAGDSDTVILLFVCATIENFGAAGFIATLGPYVFKLNQTKDRSALLEAEIPKK
jgi:hypothetical protein